MREVITFVVGFVFFLAVFIDVCDLSQLLHKKA